MALTLGGNSNIVIDVVQTVKTDSWTATAPSGGLIGIEIPGLTATITPKASRNMILVLWAINGSVVTDGYLTLYRNGQPLDLAIGTGSNAYNQNGTTAVGPRGMTYEAFNWSGMFLDTPGDTSAYTYSFYLNGNSTAYVNRAVNTDASEHFISTLTLMEFTCGGDFSG